MSDPSTPDPSGFPSVPDAAPPQTPPPPAAPSLPPTPPSAPPSAPPPQYAPPGATPPPQPGAPQYTPPPAPPGAAGHPGYAQPAYAQPGSVPPGYAQPGFAPGGVTPEKGPRPKTPVGGWMMIVGAVIAIVAVFLPWASDNGRSVNGMDDFTWIDGFTFYSVESPGMAVLIGAAIMIGLGIATVAAGRVLAVAIIGIVSGALGVIGGLIEIGLVASYTDFEGGSLGAGVLLQPVAPIISLIGAIIVTAKKRRPT